MPSRFFQSGGVGHWNTYIAEIITEFFSWGVVVLKIARKALPDIIVKISEWNACSGMFSGFQGRVR